MNFSNMSVDEIIAYLFTEAENGRVFSIDELDKAVEACSIIDRTANSNAITIFYSGGEDAVINSM